MQKVRDYLIEKDINPSQQRIAVMKYLWEHHSHPSANDIYEALHPDMPTLSLTTVYNTLNLLAEKGAILSIQTGDRMCHYDGDMTPHLHLYCTECGRIIDKSVEDMSFFSKEAAIIHFEILDTQILIKGHCAECAKKEKNNNNQK